MKNKKIIILHSIIAVIFIVKLPKILEIFFSSFTSSIILGLHLPFAMLIDYFSLHCVEIGDQKLFKLYKENKLFRLVYIFLFPVSALFLKKHEPIGAMFGKAYLDTPFYQLLITATLLMRIPWFLFVIFVYSIASLRGYVKKHIYDGNLSRL